MSDVIDFYAQHVPRSSVDWLNQRRQAGLAAFRRFGFPRRGDEAWKYTSTDALLKQRFTPVVAHQERSVSSMLPAEMLTISCVDGSYPNLDAIRARLPQGVILKPLLEACVEHADLVKPYLGTILKQEHGFHALNTAMIQHGLFIYIPKGLSLTQPLCLSHLQPMQDGVVHLRHLIVVEAGGQASVIEEYHGIEGSYWTNTVTEIALQASARLTHYKIQRESSFAYHVGHTAVQQAANSRFENHLLHFGGRWSRSDLQIDLNESGASCLMNGLYVGSGSQHLDQQTRVHHDVPGCVSEQNYKGILMGAARGVFNGQVFVAKHAIQTVAKQQNKNLLLSDRAEVDTKPQLDIYADDVVCSHGATVGQLDEDALFYLATRGIEPSEARRYLIHAFAQENLRWIEQDGLRAWLDDLLMANINLE